MVHINFREYSSSSPENSGLPDPTTILRARRSTEGGYEEMEKDGGMCRIYPLLLLCRSHDRRRRRTTHYRDYAREEAGKVSKAAGRGEREKEGRDDGARKGSSAFSL